MLFPQIFWPGIVDGSVTLTYRLWAAPRAVAGRRHRVAGGMIEITEVAEADPAAITEADATGAGFPTREDLLADLRKREGETDRRWYRVRFRYLGADPRDALAGDGALSAEQRTELDRRLARLDKASTHGPWTAATLDVIAAHPGTRAGDLAALLGRERDPFKIDVRKLKNLGLTLSLEVGYRLSPRGEAYRDGR